MVKTETTKEKIFNAAAELFAETGYANVSMRDIAQKVGIKAASIYNHYTAKDEILNEMLDYYAKRQSCFQEDINNIDLNQEPEDCFKQLILYYDEAEIQLMTWIMRIVYSEMFTNPKAAESFFGGTLRQGAKNYARFFGQLEKKGVIKGNFSPFYAEMLVRAGVVYAMQFLGKTAEYRDEDCPTMEQLYMFIFRLALHYDPEKI